MDNLVSDQPSSEHTQQVFLKTLEVLSGKWRLRIIFQLGEQPLRYSDLRRMLPGVSEKVLIVELRELVALGFIQKESFRQVPPRVEYSLTQKAKSIMPILYQLTRAVTLYLM